MRKQTTELKKWAKYLNRRLTKEDREKANKHMERCSTLSVIKKLQIKTMIRNYYTFIKMAKIPKLTMPNAEVFLTVYGEYICF